MTVLKEGDGYVITSEMSENCTTETGDWISMGALFITIAAFVGLIIQETIDYIILALTLFLFGTTTLSAFLGRLWKSCGAKITVEHTSVYGAEKRHRTYAFTNDAAKDAENIRTIVSELSYEAEQLIAREKERDAMKITNKDECCIRFKTVMEKLKKE